MRRPRLEVLAFLVAAALFAIAVREARKPSPRLALPFEEPSTLVCQDDACAETTGWFTAELEAVVDAGDGIWMRFAGNQLCLCRHQQLDMVENLSDPEGLCVPETCECAPARVRRDT
jgi:hypothetical protein